MKVHSWLSSKSSRMTMSLSLCQRYAYVVIALVLLFLYYKHSGYIRKWFLKVRSQSNNQVLYSSQHSTKFGELSNSGLYPFNSNLPSLPDRSSSKASYNSFSEMVKARASIDKTILLAMADMGAYEMAVNFYETSLKKFSIQNYLLVSLSAKACDRFEAEGIACFHYASDSAADKRSTYNSKDFNRKVNIRANFILEALELGYNVLHTDVDMYFYGNPFNDLPCQNGDCDVAVMWDIRSHNSGFLYIRSTRASIDLYKDMKNMSNTTTTEHDQTYFNRALDRLKNKIRLNSLDRSKYMCGRQFYETTMNHHFDDSVLKDNSKLIVVHNNWIVGIESKIYRFKEYLQWHYDGDSYYTSRTRKYLSYSNPTSFLEKDTKAIWKREKTALQNALMIGALLNRTVILPTFHCQRNFCSLLHCVSLITFDSVFADQYRESLFLRHPKIPPSIKKSISTEYVIDLEETLNLTQTPQTVRLRPSDHKHGPTAKELHLWFDNVEEHVLNFAHLYGNFEHLIKLAFGRYSTFEKAFAEAFK